MDTISLKWDVAFGSESEIRSFFDVSSVWFNQRLSEDNRSLFEASLTLLNWEQTNKQILSHSSKYKNRTLKVKTNKWSKVSGIQKLLHELYLKCFYMYRILKVHGLKI